MGSWNAKYGMRKAECGITKVECGMRDEETVGIFQFETLVRYRTEELIH
jgi:hypothetical protein